MDIRIGELARQAGVGIDTVRYYERSGMLAPSGRLPSGYRTYSTDEVRRLRFIRRAQGLGFSLREIRDLLALSSRRDIARVKRTAVQKLADVDERIRQLSRMREGLAALVAACPGHGQAAECPILHALGGEPS